MSINRSIFEHLSQNLFEKCKESMKQALKNENLTIKILMIFL
jgi:molecular chaperone DnaK (HSP70)